ncbi:hypothetical protein BDN70DRAFT_843717 [Pholiota conissans]|uniref:Heterokaryon incompatibility domain-containing protein n=1 Tax=Pholiota conissans TaxID=109636 RepID=A0A9P5YRA2_9AGAR|nr:hypothetical protein BDN70DRAFT_843717 [Pholiota conissans]
MAQATGANAEASDGRSDDQGPSGLTNEVQIGLLTALRKVIIPLVETAVPNSKCLDDVPMGHEAVGLLIALQKYITSVIQDGTKTRVVDLTEMCEKADVHDKRLKKELVAAEDGGGDSLNTPTAILNGNTYLHPENSTSDVEEKVIFRNPNGVDVESCTLKEMSTRLQRHVFNTLPIRLLYFRKSDLDRSKLEISLLERGEVYSYIEKIFRRSLVTRHEDIPAAYVLPEEEHPIFSTSRYAILSHTWLRSSPEVTYDAWRNGHLELSQEGYRKLVNFCRVAEADHEVNFGWMDTVCIDKSSSSELDESIRSMYKWYEKAEICITQLADTSSIDDMANDRWFTRGWTLQEFFAPDYLKFYNRDWNQLDGRDKYNDRQHRNIQQRIQQATGISSLHMNPPMILSISLAMQWAATRQVTRGEDIAYSLMGLFNVNMSIAYGEGALRAFSRLVQEILNTRGDKYVLDIFNYGGGHAADEHLVSGNLLPLTPKAYLDRCDFKFSMGPLIEPLVLTHLGLRIPVLLLPAAPGLSWKTKYIPVGHYLTNPITYTIPGAAGDIWGGKRPVCLNILDVASKKPAFQFKKKGWKCIVAVLNFTTAPDDMNICIPSKCLAAIYMYDQAMVQIKSTTEMTKIPTKNPITFNLRNKTMPNFDQDFYTVRRSELARHGMQFLTMYL